MSEDDVLILEDEIIDIDVEDIFNMKREEPTLGAKISDAVTKIVGSWEFILIQLLLIIVYLAFNYYIMGHHKWDDAPYMLLNLLLSFQAAFTAPIIMMSQNRQSQIDRNRAEIDYEVNIKAEQEIEEVTKKIDSLKDNEIKMLLAIVKKLEKKIK